MGDLLDQGKQSRIKNAEEVVGVLCYLVMVDSDCYQGGFHSSAALFVFCWQRLCSISSLLPLTRIIKSNVKMVPMPMGSFPVDAFLYVCTLCGSTLPFIHTWEVLIGLYCRMKLYFVAACGMSSIWLPKYLSTYVSTCALAAGGTEVETPA